MKQAIGLKAQMSDTCRQDNIAPQPKTIKVPNANVIGAIDINVPRIEGSLEKTTLSISLRWFHLNYLISLA